MPEIAQEYILCYKDTQEKENRSSAPKHIYILHPVTTKKGRERFEPYLHQH